MSDTTGKRSRYRSINPASGKEEKVFEPVTDEKMGQIVNKAHEAFGKWKKKSYAERGELMNNVACLMRERKTELARLCSIEMGKLLKEAVSEVELCANICEYYAKNAEEFLKDKPLEVQHGKAFVMYEPLGVILSIQPWNFPYYQIIRSAAPHIMAGNTFILKQAHSIPQCALAMEKVFQQAGFPEGVYTNVFITEQQSDALIANKHIRGISFTGSEAGGSAVASKAGKWVKVSVLELGGNDPYIVLEENNWEYALDMVVKGRLTNTGQVCSSPKRVIVMQSIADEFIQKAKEKFEQVKVGDPLDPTTEMGPLSSEKALEKVLKQIDDSVNGAGARIVCGGKRMDRPGFFMEPTILTHILPGTVAYKEEIFGPVMLIFPVKDEEEAIRLANDSAYGLGATVICKDEERAVKVARQIESGMVYINHPTETAPELPFGGVKNSGYGRELSKEGLKEFVNKKLIRTSSPDADY